MTLIERLRARLTYLRNEADAAYFRDAADALDAAQAMAEALEQIIEMGTTQLSVRIGDMYDLQTGYQDFAEVSEEAVLAQTVLTRFKETMK